MNRCVYFYSMLIRRFCLPSLTAARVLSSLLTCGLIAETTAADLRAPKNEGGSAPQSNSPAKMIRQDMALELDASAKEITTKPGQESCGFEFTVRNISAADVVISDVKTSCGCSVARMPSKPWIIRPGASDLLRLDVDLRGKSGVLTKSATIETLSGTKSVLFTVKIAPIPVPAMTLDDRQRALELAKIDRQAVFKGDCAKCHAAPAGGLAGKRLYEAACGICHEAEHRASMVPNLRTLEHETNADFWRAMIVAGKPGTLMPGFSADMGGPLTKQQIDALVVYMTQTFPPKVSAAKSAAP